MQNDKDKPQKEEMIAFPIEAIFPGTHAERPDIAAAEAEAFLEHGYKPRGFDISKPDVKAALLTRKPFVSFQINPLPPHIEAELEKLPDDWEARGGYSENEVTISELVRKHYDIPAHLLPVVDGKGIWVIPA